MCSFRLRPSHLTDQIDKEQLQFTNTEVATQPRIPVRGLWIFKFLQRTYKKIVRFLIDRLVDQYRSVDVAFE